eukprot:9097474-Pyramimonas_sp.AAC.1
MTAQEAPKTVTSKTSKILSKTALKRPKRAPSRFRQAPETVSDGVRRVGNALRPKRPPKSPQRVFPLRIG